MSFLADSSFTFGTISIRKQSLYSFFVIYMFPLALLDFIITRGIVETSSKYFTNSFYNFLKVFVYFNDGLALNVVIEIYFALWQVK